MQERERERREMATTEKKCDIIISKENIQLCACRTMHMSDLILLGFQSKYKTNFGEGKTGK